MGAYNTRIKQIFHSQIIHTWFSCFWVSIWHSINSKIVMPDSKLNLIKIWKISLFWKVINSNSFLHGVCSTNSQRQLIKKKQQRNRENNDFWKRKTDQKRLLWLLLWIGHVSFEMEGHLKLHHTTLQSF